MNSLSNNANYSVESEKFLFLYNDLTAADWVTSVKADVSDDLLVGRFMEIHQVFLGRLGRKERGIFAKVSREHLARVVRGWILLYRRTLDLLREQYPSSECSRGLVIGKVNWSDRLRVSASGLILIDHSSRYAEYWAERSIKTIDGYSSFESRFSFVGSNTYNDYAQLIRSGEFLVLDSFSNGVTSYDMMLFLKESSCSPDLFLSEISKLGWRLEIGDKKAINYLFQIYDALESDSLHI
jgi:hypothetical protein